MYSKDALFSAQENFTTEALAACIRADADPMLIALRALAVKFRTVKGPVGEARWMRVRTQVALPSGGIVDGILTYGDDRRVLGEIWLEVKIASPEGLGQLAGYVDAAALQTGIDDLPRDVVALSKVPLQRDAPWLDWRMLYVAAAGATNPWWQDFRRFMEETQVADASMLPITDREAGAIADSARLLQKVSAIARRVNAETGRVWADPPLRLDIHWAADGNLLNHLGAVFLRTGRLLVESAALHYGAVELDGTAYWYLAVTRRQVPPASLERLVARARQNGLGVDWEPRCHQEEFLIRSTRVASLSDLESATAWFASGLEDLRRSKLLTEVVVGGAASPIGEPAEGSAQVAASQQES